MTKTFPFYLLFGVYMSYKYIEHMHDKSWYYYLLLSLLYGGAGVTFAYETFMDNVKQNIDDNQNITHEDDTYLTFLDRYIEEMADIIEDEELNDAYRKTDEKYIKELQNKENHYDCAIPNDYKPNANVILYYSKDDECYYYYANGEINYKVLNAVCRGYVVEKKCIHLFQDEDDLKRVQFIIDSNNNSEDDNKKIEQLCKDNNEEFEEIQTDDVDNGEEKNERTSIFYFSKFDKRNEKKNTNKKLEKKINKFIQKGNIEDYKSDCNKLEMKENSSSIKDINYDSYKNMFNIFE